MVQITPYLAVKNALEALSVYEKIFSSTTVEHNPVTEEQREYFSLTKEHDLSKTTMHCEFHIGEAIIYMSDNFSSETSKNSNVSLTLIPDSLEQMEEYYENAKANGCNITMEMKKEFWGAYFCSFTDPFGIVWSMNFTPQE